MGELIISLESYSIYKSYINDSDSYYICIPNGNISKCQIVLGFSNKNLDTLSDNDIINKISEVYDIVYNLDNSSIYAIPNIDETVFKEAVLENDNRLYDNILNKYIHPITQNIYNMLVKNGIKKENINQVINVIKKTDSDKKFAGWLSMRIGDSFINEIDYNNLVNKYGFNDESSKIYISFDEDYSTNSSLKDDSTIYDEDISVLENESNELSNNDYGIAPINHDHDNIKVNETKNRLVRRKIKPINRSQGFGSFKFILVFMLITMIVGISIGYLLIK